MVPADALSVPPADQVCAPLMVSVPEPSCSMVPAPPTALPKTTASLRSNVSDVELLMVTAPVPNAPAVPPLPTWSVPPEIVVAPVLLFRPLNICVPAPTFVTPRRRDADIQRPEQ